jgi:hypothetical protein
MWWVLIPVADWARVWKITGAQQGQSKVSTGSMVYTVSFLDI